MPLEIKELTIQVAIVQESGSSPGTTVGLGNATSGMSSNDPGSQSALIQEVVEKVLEILKNKEAR
jgi:hypothetical protein